AKKIGLVNSTAGFTIPTEHWDTLRQLGGCGNPSLPEKVFLVGREEACKEAERLFRGQITQLVLAIESELDAEDFVAAFLASLDENTRRSLSNKCIFVKDSETWNSMVTLKTAHVLVAHPSLDLESSGEQLHREAIRRGHAVIIPVSGGSAGRTEKLVPLR